SDSAWTTISNWVYADGTTQALYYPPFGAKLADIVIDTTTGKNNLELGSGVGGTSPIKIKSLTNNAGKTVDFGSCSLEADTLTNNGTVRAVGASTQSITGTMVNGSGSTVEYYGDFAKLLWDGNATSDGMQYENLLFKSVTSVSPSVSDKIAVNGNLVFDTTKDMSFAGNVNVTGNVDVDNTGNLSFAGVVSVTGTSDINSGTGKKISFGNTSDTFGNISLGNVDLTVSATLTKPVTVYGNANLDAAFSTSSDLTVEKSGVLDTKNYALSFGNLKINKNGTDEGTLTAGSSTITVSGNWNDETDSGFDSGTGKVIFSGSTISVKEKSAFNIVETSSSSITLQNALTVNSTFTYENALSVVGDYNVTFKDAVSSKNTAKDLSFTGSGTVTFEKTLDNAENVAISGNAVFKDKVGETSGVASITVSGTSA
ncbi:MAG: hypothetical protein HUK25_08350, partial [Treponema sp.]|nr:hypothetical protein [Treponema sp.]